MKQESQHDQTINNVLPCNAFYGTTIAVNILVLSKHKTDTLTQFIDASGEDFFKKETNNNVVTDDHITQIMAMFDRKADVEHVAQSLTVAQIDQLRADIDVIVAEIEGEAV